VLTALVVDDEPLARRRLAEMLRDVPWARQVGEAGDGERALELIDALRPDVVLLDVEMPEVGGLAVVERLATRAAPPALIFTTAYEHYAVHAFELRALDYLLKPFGQQRFEAALRRVQERRDLQARLDSLERARDALDPAANGAPFTHLFVREGASVRTVRVADVVRVQGEDDYAAIHTATRRHLVSLRLAELEERLPSPPFLRVHRSHIVNLDHVERLHRLDEARLEVRLHDGTAVPVSRTRSREIRRLAR
jgi:two-component system LytT family response regulator